MTTEKEVNKLLKECVNSEEEYDMLIEDKKKKTKFDYEKHTGFTKPNWGEEVLINLNGKEVDMSEMGIKVEGFVK